jgi:HEAT repeat protein
MKRRVLLAAAVLVAVSAAVAVCFPPSRYLLQGLFWRETFYAGRPKSFWVDALKNQEKVDTPSGPSADIGKVLADGGPAAVPVLVEMLHDEDQEVRFQATLALGAMDPSPRDAAPALADALFKEENRGALSLGTRILVQIDPDAAVAMLASTLREHPKMRRRIWAATDLAGLGIDARAAVPALRETLKATNATLRLTAAQSLWRITHHGEEIVPVACELIRPADKVWQESASRLGSPDPALQLLRDMGPQAAPAIPKLMQVIKYADVGKKSNERYSAILAIDCLGTMGPRAREVEPELIALLRDPELRFAAARSLCRIDPGLLGTTRTLVKIKAPVLRSYAALVYCTLQQVQFDYQAGTPTPSLPVHPTGPDRELISVLVGAIGDRDASTRHWAADALIWQFRSPLAQAVSKQATAAVASTIPMLTAYLNHADADVRATSARVLGELRAEARPAIPALVGSLQSKDISVQAAAAEALGKIGPEAKPAVPVLTSLLEHGDSEVRWAAVTALGRIGPGAKSAMPELIKLLKHPDLSTGELAATALGRMGPEAMTAVPALLEYYHSTKARNGKGGATAALWRIDRAEVIKAGIADAPFEVEAMGKTIVTVHRAARVAHGTSPEDATSEDGQNQPGHAGQLRTRNAN